MKKQLLILTMVFLALGTYTAAFADTVLFSDDFNGENGGIGILNYSGFANWTISDGTVDLIGNGFFDFFPGNGLYVDLDGSTGDAGFMVSRTFSLNPGQYEFAFDLAGNQRNAGIEQVTVQVLAGPLFNNSYQLGSLDPFQTKIAPFVVTQPGNYTLTLQNLGGDNIGALLDNVTLTQISAVPEPTSLLLLGTGVIGIGLAAWRRKKA